MLGRQLMTVLAISVLALAGGLGYAAFTSSATVTGTAYAGTDGIQVTSLSSPICTGVAAINSVSGTPASAVTFNAGYFAPGDTCSVVVTLQNTGNLIEAVTSSSSVSGPYFTTADTGVSPSSLNPGQSAYDTIYITLPSGLGNGAEGAVAAITYTYTATAGS